MKLLSRAEELVLLAAWRLQDRAYSVTIREDLIQVTGKKWSFGAIYDPLGRLERNGLLRSILSEPTKVRGGRSKRIYRLTEEGKRALVEISEVEKAMWKDILIAELKMCCENK